MKMRSLRKLSTPNQNLNLHFFEKYSPTILEIVSIDLPWKFFLWIKKKARTKFPHFSWHNFATSKMPFPKLWSRCVSRVPQTFKKRRRTLQLLSQRTLSKIFSGVFDMSLVEGDYFMSLPINQSRHGAIFRFPLMAKRYARQERRGCSWIFFSHIMNYRKNA